MYEGCSESKAIETTTNRGSTITPLDRAIFFSYKAQFFYIVLTISYSFLSVLSLNVAFIKIWTSRCDLLFESTDDGIIVKKIFGGCPRGVMVKAMDCGIVVREFVLQSHYYVHFQANTLGKSMNLLILPAMG